MGRGGGGGGIWHVSLSTLTCWGFDVQEHLIDGHACWILRRASVEACIPLCGKQDDCLDRATDHVINTHHPHVE